MAKRRKLRRRKDGSIADGRLDPQQADGAYRVNIDSYEALMIEQFANAARRDLRGPVDPDLLLKGLQFKQQFMPFEAAEWRAIEERESVRLLRQRDNRYSRAISKLVPDSFAAFALGERVDALAAFLGDEGASYYRIEEDGTIWVHPDLLVFAATTPLSENLEETLTWSPEQARDDGSAG
ncbi:hypothetical protein [Sphingomonas sp. BK069]|uniref:hypothetical protein n=1 Tax=Sphingomonas sp. BK069 TaxID=2586979 RepID=UPI001611DDA9|nr:hypothetical protein [Sphingomonas sp. BK069]MBB3345971.1 hypothetical protein [Sphingomonas sp. BK069]